MNKKNTIFKLNKNKFKYKNIRSFFLGIHIYFDSYNFQNPFVFIYFYILINDSLKERK